MDEKRFKSLFPNASAECVKLNAGLRSERSERTDLSTLAGKTQRETKGDGRVVLSYELHRVRLLDPDNAVGSTKTITDCLREIGLLADDTERHVQIVVEQKKVAHYKDQKTVVSILYPQ